MNVRRSIHHLAVTMFVSTLSLSCGGDDAGTGVTPPSQTGSVAGSVQDDSAQPVSGAAVTLQQSGVTVQSANTSASGTFSFASLQPGGYAIGVTPPSGYAPDPGQANPASVTVTGGQTSNVALRVLRSLPEEGEVEGRVRLNGQGVQGALVALEGPRGSAGQRATDSDGDYTFDDLTPGEYTVTLTPPAPFVLVDGEVAARSATVVAGQSADVDYELALAAASPVVQIELTGALRFVGESGGSTETIPRGTTIRWVNTTNMAHTVTPSGHDAWNRAQTQVPETVLEVLFINPGTFAYFCEPHQSQGMTGTIVVQ